MNYFETFETLKKIIDSAKIKQGDRHIAIQVCITDDDASGIFYIEDFKDRVIVEPYDYFDNDAEIKGRAYDLKMLFTKELDLKKALENNVISIQGDISAAENFISRIPKPKKTVKKAASKKTAEKKTTKKKTEAKKMTEDTKKKETPKKDTETIKEVVEKEIPKK